MLELDTSLYNFIIKLKAEFSNTKSNSDELKNVINEKFNSFFNTFIEDNKFNITALTL